MEVVGACLMELSTVCVGVSLVSVSLHLCHLSFACLKQEMFSQRSYCDTAYVRLVKLSMSIVVRVTSTCNQDMEHANVCGSFYSILLGVDSKFDLWNVSRSQTC